MIITFIGHSVLHNSEYLSEKLKNIILKNMKGDDNICFYCGGYGDFDNLCARVCHFIKEEQHNCKVVFITPYVIESYKHKIKSISNTEFYDSIIYPPLEKVPFRFAISRRNEWMVDQADVIIAYVKYTHGGAYKSMEYAKRKNKNIINLAQEIQTTFT